MAFACPHCTKDIPNVVPQETMTERLGVKEAANEALRGKVTDLEAKVTRLTPFEAQVTTLQGELEKQKGASAKIAAAAKVGLNPDKMRLAETAYEMAHEGVEASKRPAFDAWLADEKGARANDDIKHLFATLGTPAKPGEAPAGKPTTKPDAPPPGAPPGGSGKWTPAQVTAYFQSPEFKALPRADQYKKMNELEAQTKAAPTQDGRT